MSDPGNMSVSFIAELSPVYCCLVWMFFASSINSRSCKIIGLAGEKLRSTVQTAKNRNFKCENCSLILFSNWRRQSVRKLLRYGLWEKMMGKTHENTSTPFKKCRVLKEETNWYIIYGLQFPLVLIRFPIFKTLSLCIFVSLSLCLIAMPEILVHLKVRS